MTFDEHIAQNKAVFVESDHRWKQLDADDGGGIDFFAFSFAFCNGPACEDCDFQRCVHCNCGDKIPSCTAVRVSKP